MSEPNDKGRWESFLPVPDEIVINILSRLHPRDVLRCRCVVKRWRDLTSTPYFVELHKQRSIAHMILVDLPKRKRGYRDQFFIDEWWITARKKPPILKIHSQSRHYSSFFQDGLLVMSSSCPISASTVSLDGCMCIEEIVIVNRIFREKVKIGVADEWHSWIRKVYGVYFNPTLNEFCALFDVTSRAYTFEQLFPYATSPPAITYKVLTLGPKPCLRDIRDPYKNRSVLRWKLPAKVDGFIYWMMVAEDGDKYGYYADIMEFDTRSDEFKLMPCPAPMITDYGRFGLDLHNIDGFLSFVQIVVKQGVVEVNMWTLKDRASESWTCSHYDLDYKVRPPTSEWTFFETIAVRCGEILIRSEQKLCL